MNELLHRAKSLVESATNGAPAPWVIDWTGDSRDEDEGIDCIRAANGEYVVVGDSGVYPPHGRLAEFSQDASAWFAFKDLVLTHRAHDRERGEG